MKNIEKDNKKTGESNFPTINLQKGNDTMEPKNKDKVITEKMAEEISAICANLFVDGDKFEGKQETTFNALYEYIRIYKRILYSQISSEIYACYDKESNEEANNKLGTLTSNLEKLIAYTSSVEYDNLKKDKQRAAAGDGLDIAETFEDAEKALIKIYDHTNLAMLQYSGLKQTDEEYGRKFDSSIRPVKEKLVKEMNAQLLTLVGIFTALSFALLK